jgi:hypothetical protein
VCKILVRPLGRPRHSEDDSIKICLMKKRPMVGPYEHSNKTSGFINGR